MAPTGQGKAAAEDVGASQGLIQHASFEQAALTLNAQDGLPNKELNEAMGLQLLLANGEGRNQPQCKLTIKNELTMSQDTFQYRGAPMNGQGGEQRVGTPNVLPQP